MSRRAVLGLVAGVSILAAVLGWVLGQRIQSPAEAAAATAAPKASLITVPVEERELSSRVVVRGTLEASEATPINVSGSAEGTPIVTRLPVEVNDELAEGDLVIEVTGRPVIVLQGQLPVYRSMGPSMEGPDVQQLEEALLRLGYDPGTVDNTYTAATATAVEALYDSLGYRADEPSAQERSALNDARDRVADARKTVDSLSTGSSDDSITESERLQLDLGVTQAQREVDDARAGRDDAIAEAAQAVTDATTARDQAQTALDAAQSDLTEAQGGTNPATGQPPTDEELTDFEAGLSAAQQAVTDAQRALDQATATQGRAATEQDRLISDAESNLAIAEASRDERLNPPADQGGSGDSLADARKQLARAQADLAELEASTGTRLPAAEVVFVPTLPRRVQSLNTRLGAEASETVMTLTGSETVLNSAVSATDYKLLAEGMEARIEDAELDIDARATITLLADSPGGDGLASDRYAMRLTPATDLPEEALFQSLRLTIPISSTGGDVLAVPLAAVSAGSDGDPRVEVQRSDGSTELVEVVTGLSADGYVEVSPRDGTLEAGDQVVVGRDLQLPGQANDADSDAGDADTGSEDADSEDSGGEGEGDA